MNTARQKSVARSMVLFLAVLVIALVSGTAWAQTSNGTLVGSVTDPYRGGSAKGYGLCRERTVWPAP